MREVRLPLSGFVLFSSMLCGSFWIAIHAIWKLQEAGQGVWRIVWPGLLFGTGMGFITYLNRR